MMRLLVVSAGLVALAGCGGSPGPVGENSADSITTTAVGNVVATAPSPTPAYNAAASVADNGAMTDDSVVSNDAASTDAPAGGDTPHGE